MSRAPARLSQAEMVAGKRRLPSPGSPAASKRYRLPSPEGLCSSLTRLPRSWGSSRSACTHSQELGWTLPPQTARRGPFGPAPAAPTRCGCGVRGATGWCGDCPSRAGLLPKGADAPAPYVEGRTAAGDRRLPDSPGVALKTSKKRTGGGPSVTVGDPSPFSRESPADPAGTEDKPGHPSAGLSSSL